MIRTAQGGTPAVTEEQLKLLDIPGVTPENLPAIIEAIKNTPDDGTGVDTIAELKKVVSDTVAAAQAAVNVISDAAQANNATPTTPAVDVYKAAGVTGVADSNLALINDILNDADVTGASVDTVKEIQDIVDAVNKIVNAADGVAGNNSLALTPEDYAKVGVNNIDSPAEASLLNQVIDLSLIHI